MLQYTSGGFSETAMEQKTIDYLYNFQREHGLTSQTLLNLLLYKYFQRRGLNASANAMSREGHLEEILQKFTIDPYQTKFLENNFKSFWQKFISKALQANNDSPFLVLNYLNDKPLMSIEESFKKKMSSTPIDASNLMGNPTTTKDSKKRPDDKLMPKSKKIKKPTDHKSNSNKSPSPKKGLGVPGEDDIYLDNADGINAKVEDKQNLSQSESNTHNNNE